MGKYLDDLKGQVAAAEGKIDGMYLELGKKCYELYADSPDEAIKDEIGAIKKTFDEIDTVKGNIEKAEKCEICPDCGSVVPEGFRFCGNCGVKLNLTSLTLCSARAAARSLTQRLLPPLRRTSVRTAALSTKREAFSAQSAAPDFNKSIVFNRRVLSAVSFCRI